MDSSFGTASLIGSVLRDLNSPDLQPNTSTPQLEAIMRMCLAKIDALDRKIDYVISMVTPQPAPAPVVPEVSIRVPVEATPPTFSPAAESVQAQSEMIGSVGLLTTDKLVALKLNAKSRANFAVLLLKELFNPKELEGKNIAGVRGKEMVDPERITEIKNMLQRFYPVPAADEESCWRMCRKAMDEFLRRPSWRRKRAE